MILIIDNYDSFTYNLVQQVGRLGFATEVRLNDACSLDELIAMQPDKLIISPGPRTPADAGICVDAFKYFESRIPVLGVCLGHQVIAASCGIGLRRAKHPFHGSIARIKIMPSELYQGLNNSIAVARYHSLVIDAIPNGYRLTGIDSSNEIMSMQHNFLPVFGVQFHPESFMTELGDTILDNFLSLPNQDRATAVQTS